jgi:hypothetical protein
VGPRGDGLAFVEELIEPAFSSAPSGSGVNVPHGVAQPAKPGKPREVSLIRPNKRATARGDGRAVSGQESIQETVDAALYTAFSLNGLRCPIRCVDP